MRVIDQDKVFLRFIENHNLKPGESIEVEDRDAASDSVRVRGKDDQRDHHRDARRVEAAGAGGSVSAAAAVGLRLVSRDSARLPPP